MPKPSTITAAKEFTKRHRVPVLLAGLLVVALAGWAYVVVSAPDSGDMSRPKSAIDDRSPRPRPSHLDTNEGRYRFGKVQNVCADVDWAVLEDAFGYEDDGWRDELRERRDEVPGDDGTGWRNCMVALPVVNNADLYSPDFHANFTIRSTDDDAVGWFESDEEADRDRREWRSLDMDAPKFCEDYYATTHVTELLDTDSGERDPNAPMLEVGCRDGNALVTLKMTQYNVDDGSGSHDVTYVVKSILNPIAEAGFAGLGRND